MLSQIFGTISAISALLAFIIYFKQVQRGKSTPNLATWSIVFCAGLINTITYIIVVKGNLWQSLYLIIVTSCVLWIILYAAHKKMVTRISKSDIALFILVAVIGIFWQITNNARIANLLLQSIYIIAFIPTIKTLISREAKEEYPFWLTIVISYLCATTALLTNMPNDWIAFINPVVSGIMGNGTVLTIVLWHKRQEAKQQLAHYNQAIQK